MFGSSVNAEGLSLGMSVYSGAPGDDTGGNNRGHMYLNIWSSLYLTVENLVNPAEPATNGSFRNYKSNVPNGTGQPITVNYQIVNQTATQGSDFVLANGSTTIANGASNSANISIPITDDSAVEGSETFKLDISSASSPDPLVDIWIDHPDNERQFTISDNDPYFIDC